MKRYRGPELLVVVLGVEVHAEMRLRGLDEAGVGDLLHERDGHGHVVLLLALPQLLYLEVSLGPRLHAFDTNITQPSKMRRIYKR